MSFNDLSKSKPVSQTAKKTNKPTAPEKAAPAQVAKAK